MRSASTSIRSLTRAPAGSGASRREVPAASRYDANSRTRTEIRGCAVVSDTGVSIRLASIQPGNWAARDGVRKSPRGGVLSVNGDDHQEDHVLRLDEPASEAVTRFDGLFGQFYPELFGLLYRVLSDRMETEDTLQEAFLKLSEYPDLQARPDAEVSAWLRRVGLNLAFNRLRSNRRSQARLERVGRLERSEDEPLANDLSGPAGVVVRREQRDAVRRALAEVPEHQRECLLLRHSGYSYTEIAATLGIAVGSVGVLLARGEHAFRAHYRRLEAHP